MSTPKVTSSPQRKEREMLDIEGGKKRDKQKKKRVVICKAVFAPPNRQTGTGHKPGTRGSVCPPSV